jgi:hypothetical protein
MQTNFQFRDSIYLVFDNFEFDLHNDYDFTRVEYSVLERTVELHWRRSSGDWVKPDIPRAITLRFDDVSRFEFKPRDANVPFTEDDCLATVGYLADADWCKGIFWTEGVPEVDWMHAFEFMSGAVIALQSKESRVTIES